MSYSLKATHYGIIQGYINWARESDYEVLFWGAERYGKGLTSSFLRNQFTFLRFWAIGGSRKVRIPYDLAIFMKICESFKTKKEAFLAKILITRRKSAMLKTMVLVLRTSEHVGNKNHLSEKVTTQHITVLFRAGYLNIQKFKKNDMSHLSKSADNYYCVKIREREFRFREPKLSFWRYFNKSFLFFKNYHS